MRKYCSTMETDSHLKPNLRNNVLQVSKNNDEESNLLLKSPMCSILSLDQIEHTNYHGKPRSPGDCW